SSSRVERCVARRRSYHTALASADRTSAARLHARGQPEQPPSVSARNRNLGRPREPLLLRLVVEQEDGAILGRQALGTRSCEDDAAGDERAKRVDVDVDALEEARLDVDAAGVPELRSHPYQARIPRLDQHVDVRGAAVPAEPGPAHHADLDATVVHGGARTDG